MKKPKYPNYASADVEAAAPVKGRGAEAAKSGISVMSFWGMNDIAPKCWLLDDSRLPRTILTESHLEKEAKKYDGLVTWNGLGYDWPVMCRRVPDTMKHFKKLRHIDLHAVVCLLQAGVEPERLTGNLPDNWSNMVPHIADGFLSTGWGLEAVGLGTLGIGKTDGPAGAASVTAWMQGRYSEIITYNLQDTGLLRELYIFAWENGYLISSERGRVNIPREVLE